MKGAIAYDVPRDLDLHFQGHAILNANIWKTVRANENFSIMTFIDVGIRHRMAALRILYSVTLTKILYVKHLKRSYLENDHR